MGHWNHDSSKGAPMHLLPGQIWGISVQQWSTQKVSVSCEVADKQGLGSMILWRRHSWSMSLSGSNTDILCVISQITPLFLVCHLFFLVCPVHIELQQPDFVSNYHKTCICHKDSSEIKNYCRLMDHFELLGCLHGDYEQPFCIIIKNWFISWLSTSQTAEKKPPCAPSFLISKACTWNLF